MSTRKSLEGVPVAAAAIGWTASSNVLEWMASSPAFDDTDVAAMKENGELTLRHLLNVPSLQDLQRFYKYPASRVPTLWQGIQIVARVVPDDGVAWPCRGEQQQPEVQKLQEQLRQLQMQLQLQRSPSIDAQLPLPLSNMNSLKEADFVDRLDFRFGITRWSLSVLKWLEDEQWNSAVTTCASALVQQLERLRKHNEGAGLFSRFPDHPDHELAWSSVAGCELERLSPHKDLRFFHQFKAAKGEIDILVALEVPSYGSIPLAVFEFGWMHTNKQWQSWGYAMNLAPALVKKGKLPNVPILAMTCRFDKNREIVSSGEIAIHVVAFHPHVAAGEKACVIPVSKKVCSLENVARTLNVLVKLAENVLASGMIDDSSARWDYPSRTVAIETRTDSKRIVHKLYDYRPEIRGKTTDHAERRKHQRMVKHGVNVEYEIGSEDSDLVVLRYPYIPGSHVASMVKHFVSATEAVVCLQEGDGEGAVIHGDIRGSNAVFDDDGNCFLIDHDITGTSEDTYPSTYVASGLNDVVRHDDARPGENLKTSHDWYALASMMEMYDVDGGDGDFWAQATEHVRKGDAHQALKCLNERATVAIKPKLTQTEAALQKQQGTGTPEKKEKEKEKSSSPDKKQKRKK